MHFDESKRGFSFRKDGPLDMRMDVTQKFTAKDLINTFSEARIASILKDFGEVKKYWKLSKLIVAYRSRKVIETTGELASIVEGMIKRYGKSHPAAKVFQAIRSFVNDERESLKAALKQAISFLSKNSLLGVITFNSLEDRIVKNIFKEASMPLRNLNGKIVEDAILKILTKKPLVPFAKEISANRRSRSAKLRLVAKK